MTTYAELKKKNQAIFSTLPLFRAIGEKEMLEGMKKI